MIPTRYSDACRDGLYCGDAYDGLHDAPIGTCALCSSAEACDPEW